MLHWIDRMLAPLLRLLRPAPGRHRSPEPNPVVPHPLPATPPLPQRPPEPVLRGEDSPPVRPYLIDHERREASRRRWVRRRTLWLAVHGVDITPRLTNDMEVTA